MAWLLSVYCKLRNIINNVPIIEPENNDVNGHVSLQTIPDTRYSTDGLTSIISIINDLDLALQRLINKTTSKQV